MITSSPHQSSDKSVFLSTLLLTDSVDIYKDHELMNLFLQAVQTEPEFYIKDYLAEKLFIVFDESNCPSWASRVKEKICSTNGYKKNLNTFLLKLCENGTDEQLQLQLEKNLFQNAKPDFKGRTFLHFAICNEKISRETLIKLVQQSCETLLIKDQDGNLPFDLIKENFNETIYACLFLKPFQPFTLETFGYTLKYVIEIKNDKILIDFINDKTISSHFDRSLSSVYYFNYIFSQINIKQVSSERLLQVLNLLAEQFLCPFVFFVAYVCPALLAQAIDHEIADSSKKLFFECQIDECIDELTPMRDELLNLTHLKSFQKKEVYEELNLRAICETNVELLEKYLRGHFLFEPVIGHKIFLILIVSSEMSEKVLGILKCYLNTLKKSENCYLLKKLVIAFLSKINLFKNSKSTLNMFELIHSQITSYLSFNIIFNTIETELVFSLNLKGYKKIIEKTETFDLSENIAPLYNLTPLHIQLRAWLRSIKSDKQNFQPWCSPLQIISVEDEIEIIKTFLKAPKLRLQNYNDQVNMFNLLKDECYIPAIYECLISYVVFDERLIVQNLEDRVKKLDYLNIKIITALLTRYPAFKIEEIFYKRATRFTKDAWPELIDHFQENIFETSVLYSPHDIYLYTSTVAAHFAKNSPELFKTFIRNFKLKSSPEHTTIQNIFYKEFFQIEPNFILHCINCIPSENKQTFIFNRGLISYYLNDDESVSSAEERHDILKNKIDKFLNQITKDLPSPSDEIANVMIREIEYLKSLNLITNNLFSPIFLRNLCENNQFKLLHYITENLPFTLDIIQDASPLNSNILHLFKNLEKGIRVMFNMGEENIKKIISQKVPQLSFIIILSSSGTSLKCKYLDQRITKQLGFTNSKNIQYIIEKIEKLKFIDKFKNDLKKMYESFFKFSTKEEMILFKKNLHFKFDKKLTLTYFKPGELDVDTVTFSENQIFENPKIVDSFIKHLETQSENLFKSINSKCENKCFYYDAIKLKIPREQVFLCFDKKINQVCVVKNYGSYASQPKYSKYNTVEQVLDKYTAILDFIKLRQFVLNNNGFFLNSIVHSLFDSYDVLIREVQDRWVYIPRSRNIGWIFKKDFRSSAMHCFVDIDLNDVNNREKTLDNCHNLSHLLEGLKLNKTTLNSLVKSAAVSLPQNRVEVSYVCLSDHFKKICNENWVIEYFKSNYVSIDEAESNLIYFIELVTKKQSILGWSIVDPHYQQKYEDFYTRTSHIIDKLSKSFDPSNFSQYVCELAVFGRNCSAKLEEISHHYYNLALNLNFITSNCFETVYRNAFYETLYLLTKYLKESYVKDQSIHIISHLKATLFSNKYKIPYDPNSGVIQNGSDDRFRNIAAEAFPENYIENVFISICLPLLINKLYAIQSEFITHHDWDALANFHNILHDRLETQFESNQLECDQESRTLFNNLIIERAEEQNELIKKIKAITQKKELLKSNKMQNHQKIFQQAHERSYLALRELSEKQLAISKAKDRLIQKLKTIEQDEEIEITTQKRFEKRDFTSTQNFPSLKLSINKELSQLEKDNKETEESILEIRTQHELVEKMIFDSTSHESDEAIKKLKKEQNHLEISLADLTAKLKIKNFIDKFAQDQGFLEEKNEGYSIVSIKGIVQILIQKEILEKC